MLEGQKNGFLDSPKFKTNYNNYGVKEIYKEIFLYENFFDPDEENFYLNLLNESDWNHHGNYESQDFVHDVFFNRISRDIVRTQPHTKDYNGKIWPNFLDRIVDMVTPEYINTQHTNFMSVRPGEKIPEMSSLTDFSSHDYVIAGYLGEWEGGELVFPKINFEYPVKRRDLLIFPSTKEYSHYVKEVKSGIRYSWVDYMFKHPGYVVV